MSNRSSRSSSRDGGDATASTDYEQNRDERRKVTGEKNFKPKKGRNNGKNSRESRLESLCSPINTD